MLHAIKSLSEINGLDISAEQAQCAPYSRDASGQRGCTPLAVARPSTVPALITLVHRAAELDLRLQPISSTGEHHRGDTLCQEKSIIVDMSAFNQVVRVDRRNRVVLFEAGVTFPQLGQALDEHKLRPLLPLCPRPGKSALTSYLEREPTIYPRFQWDLSDPLLCVETIFGSGELFRSGGAAGPGTLSEQWAAGDAQKTPMGPGHNDISRIVQGAQGNLGIVTWCSAKTEPIPAEETLYRLDSPALEKLISLSYRLLHRNLPDICFIVDSAALAALQEEPAPTGQGQWHLLFSLSAPPLLGAEKLAWMKNEVSRFCTEAGLSDQLHHYAARHQALHQRLLGTAPVEAGRWWKYAGQPATRELFFQTTLERCSHFTSVHERALVAHEWQTPTLCYIQPLLGGRNCHMEFVFPYDGSPHKAAALARMESIEVLDLEAHGAFFSRPYGPLIELTKASRSADMRARLGRVFDPAGVMASSLWPIVPQPTGLEQPA